MIKIPVAFKVPMAIYFDNHNSESDGGAHLFLRLSDLTRLFLRRSADGTKHAGPELKEYVFDVVFAAVLVQIIVAALLVAAVVSVPAIHKGTNLLKQLFLPMDSWPLVWRPELWATGSIVAYLFIYYVRKSLRKRKGLAVTILGAWAAMCLFALTLVILAGGGLKESPFSAFYPVSIAILILCTRSRIAVVLTSLVVACLSIIVATASPQACLPYMTEVSNEMMMDSSEVAAKDTISMNSSWTVDADTQADRDVQADDIYRWFYAIIFVVALVSGTVAGYTKIHTTGQDTIKGSYSAATTGDSDSKTADV